MKLGLSRLVRLSTLLCASTCFTSLAHAQQAPIPPEHYEIDARNVDIIGGKIYVPTPSIAIGDPNADGLSQSRTLIDQYWRDAVLGTISSSGSTYYVSLGNVTEVFTKAGSTFTANAANGSDLANPDLTTYVFTSAAGEVVTFSAAYQNTTNSFGANVAVITRIVRPDGLITDYSYKIGTVCKPAPEGSPCTVTQRGTRLQAISNNAGYQIHFDFVSDNSTVTLLNWNVVKKAIAFNTATDYCAPTAATCTFSRNWPSLTYTKTAGQLTVTDQNGRTSEFRYDTPATGGVDHVRWAGSSADNLTMTYAGGKIASVTDASGTWAYAYADVGTTRTTTVTGPLSHQTVYVSDLTLNRLTSVTDGQAHVRAYQYDTYGRLKRATNPEGDYAQYTYDLRGNISSTAFVPKAGSGLANIATSATYPATCANPVICNLPTSSTDALARTTDYTYDPAHGSVLTITGPAPSSGAVRPQMRYAYAQKYAWYKITGTTATQAASPIYKLEATSICISGASCAGLADEQKATFAYGFAGAANNLLPTTIGRGSGDGGTLASTTLTYSAQGDVVAVDGPLPGAVDTKVYRYDDARQPIGIIGPDPDGTASLKHRATRLTYDAGGRPTLVEQGVVNSQSDADWSAFTSLEGQASEYDGLGRKTKDSVIVAGATQSVTQYHYDLAGRLDCTAQRMNPTTFGSPPGACALGAPGGDGPDRIHYNTYDNTDRLLKVTAGYGTGAPRDDGALTYSANGQTQTATDGKGNVTTYEYDGFDRLAKTRYPNPSGGGSSTTDYESYAYDAAGNITTANRRGAVTNYSYDALNRLTYKDNSPGWYYYDNLNRPTYTYSGVSAEKAIAHYYDGLGRPSTTYDYRGGTWYPTTTSYDLAGRLTLLQWQDGFYVNYDYDAANEVTGIRENGSVQLATYTYDDLGRRTATYRGNGAQSYYGYNAAGRLGTLTLDLANVAQDQVYSYGYTAAGQIKSRVSNNDAYRWTGGTSVNRTYTINGLNQVTAIGGMATTHDARGNLTGDGATTYSYDSDNRVTGTSMGVSLAYDPLGRLGQTTGGTMTQFVYAGLDLIAELDAGNNVMRRYVPGPRTDEPLLWYEGAGVTNRRFLLPDERGSIVAVTNNSGAATTINTYDEYGVPGAGNQGRYQYTGQTFVSELGVYNYKARMYSPNLGRFLQTDPIGYGDGMNLYAYASSDPINATDPIGTTCGYQSHWVSIGGKRTLVGSGKRCPTGQILGGTPPRGANGAGPRGSSGGSSGTGNAGGVLDATGCPSQRVEYVFGQGVTAYPFPAMKSGTILTYQQFDFSFNILFGGGVARGGYEYTGYDGLKYYGHYNTRTSSLGLGFGAGFTTGDSPSLSQFFGESLSFSASAGPVTASADLPPGGGSFGVGGGVAFELSLQKSITTPLGMPTRAPNTFVSPTCLASGR